MSLRRGEAGYSLIEVMTAVVVMIVGSTGIAAMINATTRANSDAWDTTVATQVGTNWLERVKRDALLWPAAGAAGGASYLSNVTGDWFVPNPGAGMDNESWAADAFARDTRTNTAMYYCVNLQNQPVHQASGLASAVRVNLVVFWHRTARGDADVVNRTEGPVSATDGCATPISTFSADVRAKYREIYMSTVVHWVAPL